MKFWKVLLACFFIVVLASQNVAFADDEEDETDDDAETEEVEGTDDDETDETTEEATDEEVSEALDVRGKTYELAVDGQDPLQVTFNTDDTVTVKDYEDVSGSYTVADDEVSIVLNRGEGDEREELILILVRGEDGTYTVTPSDVQYDEDAVEAPELDDIQTKFKGGAVVSLNEVAEAATEEEDDASEEDATEEEATEEEATEEEATEEEATEEEATEEDDEEVDGTLSGGERGGDLSVSTAGDVVSLDPHGSNDIPSELVRNVIYDGLVGFYPEGGVELQLATDYEQVDEYTWEFTLRDDVYFHDGAHFDAEVVKMNLERITDPIVASERAFLLDMVVDVEVVDDYTVQLITEYAYASLLQNLAHGAGKMISPELIEADYQNALDEAGVEFTLDEYFERRNDGDETLEEDAADVGQYIGAVVERNPIGTGYMKFSSRSPGDNTVLERFEEFYDGEAFLDTITFRVVPETGARLAELETRSTDVVLAVGTENLDRIDATDGLELLRVESNLVDYLGINTESENLSDPLVRQALSYALDREAIIEGIYSGSGRMPLGILPPGMLGYSEDLEAYDYNLDRARELLEEAGVADGFSITIGVNDESNERQHVAIYLQESLSDLGIDLNIQQMEWGSFLTATGNGEFDLFTYGWNNSTADPDNAMYPLLHSDYKGSPGNRSFYDNPEMDQLLEDARREVDVDVREDLYLQAQDIVIEDAPMIFVRYGENLAAVHDRVQGVVLTQNNLLDLSRASFVAEDN